MTFAKQLIEQLQAAGRAVETYRKELSRVRRTQTRPDAAYEINKKLQAALAHYRNLVEFNEPEKYNDVL